MWYIGGSYENILSVFCRQVFFQSGCIARRVWLVAKTKLINMTGCCVTCNSWQSRSKSSQCASAMARVIFILAQQFWQHSTASQTFVCRTFVLPAPSTSPWVTHSSLFLTQNPAHLLFFTAKHREAFRKGEDTRCQDVGRRCWRANAYSSRPYWLYNCVLWYRNQSRGRAPHVEHVARHAYFAFRSRRCIVTGRLSDLTEASQRFLGASATHAQFLGFLVPLNHISENHASESTHASERWRAEFSTSSDGTAS
mmetsp:Transcript_14113/g.48554  ORF Transcript_14113/g.48554 Transcript_14113/m.48554 type:complete len:253 (-) Transcript_14113:381-1139(-)